MRWPVFAIFAYLALALDLGLRTLFEMNIGSSVVAPSFTLILMAYVASTAPPREARTSAVILGLLIDLTTFLPDSSGTGAVIIGPHALGYLLGCMLIVQLRTLIYRRHPLTLALLTFLGGCCAYLPVVFLLLLRRTFSQMISSDHVIHWAATDQLVRHFLIAVETGLFAIPVGWLLDRVNPLFGFQNPNMIGQRR